MEATLRDGARITIRPIGPEDREVLVRGFERLSPESRYRRFFAPVTELRSRDLDYLTHVDHHDHEALVAFAEEDPDGVGVARYVRTSPFVAEPAIVVIDDWQGRGVGGALLQALVDRARKEGIVRFEAPVLATNREAIRAFERIGQTSIRHQGREVILTIDLPAAPAAARRWSDVLRQFATGSMQPARALLQLVWPRRAGAPEDERRNVIVVGIDAASCGEDVVPAAAALALPSRSTVQLVAAARFFAGQEEELASVLQQCAGGLREQGLDVRELVRRGDPALVLSDVAEEQNARLIVVGAGGSGRRTRRLIGGVADLVAARAPCSVLIVRPRR